MHWMVASKLVVLHTLVLRRVSVVIARIKNIGYQYGFVYPRALFLLTNFALFSRVMESSAFFYFRLVILHRSFHAFASFLLTKVRWLELRLASKQHHFLHRQLLLPSSASSCFSSFVASFAHLRGRPSLQLPRLQHSLASPRQPPPLASRPSLLECTSVSGLPPFSGRKIKLTNFFFLQDAIIPYSN